MMMMTKIVMNKMKIHPLIFNVHRQLRINRIQQTNLNYFINISNLQLIQVFISVRLFYLINIFSSLSFCRRCSMWKWNFIRRKNENNEKKIWSDLVFSRYGREKRSKTNIFFFKWRISTREKFERKKHFSKWKFRKLNFFLFLFLFFVLNQFLLLSNIPSFSSSFNFPSNSIRFSFSHWIKRMFHRYLQWIFTCLSSLICLMSFLLLYIRLYNYRK